MAFKPFDYFRKRQKFILASLAILSMFLFIIGDALTGRRTGGSSGVAGRIQRLFGRSDDIAVVDGQGLDVEQLGTLARQRAAAQRFVVDVQDRGMLTAFEQANVSRDDLVRLATEFRVPLQSVHPAILRIYLDQVLQAPQLSAQQRKWLGEMKEKLASKGLADALAAQSGALSTIARLRQNPPFQTAEGLVEFVMWQKKADELGIVMSSAKVEEDLLKLGAKSFSEDELPRMAAKVRLDSDTLLRTIGDELRVMMARSVILGSSATSPFGGINEPTPADLWDAYVKIKTDLEVAILPVPVDFKDFLAQVPDPTADEIKDLYKQYKDVEPDPARETPGFRVPNKYQVEFLYGDLKNETGDAAKFYDTWVKIEDSVSAVFYQSLGDFLTPPRMLVDAASNFEVNRRFLYADEVPFVLVAAGAKPEEAAFYRAPIPAGSEAWPTAATVDKQLVGRLALAAGLAPLALQSPLSLPYVRELNKNRIEKVSRTQALSLDVANLAANASQGLSGLLTFPPHLASAVRYRAFAEVQSGIVDELLQDRRASLMEADLLQLKTRLDDYAKTDEFRRKQQDWRTAKSRAERSNQPIPAFEPPPMPSDEYWQKYKNWKVAKTGAESKKTEVPKFQSPAPGEKEDQKFVPLREYLEHFAKPRGLVLAGMKEPRSKIDLFKETGDTPLGTLLKPIFMRDQYTEQMVVQALTSSKGWYEAGEISAPANQPREFAVYWRSFESPSRTPPLAECEPQVRQAFKLIKARAKAEEAAQAIASDKEVKGNPDGYRKLIDHKDFTGYRQVNLRRYELQDPLQRADTVRYRLAKLPGFLDYPPDDFIDHVVGSLQKPGDTLVVANKPRSFYYVLFLVKREQPRANEDVWVRQFDQEVIYPDISKQMQIDDVGISRWVAQKESQQFKQEWESYVKAVTKFDSEKATRLKSVLENLMRGQGGGEEF